MLISKALVQVMAHNISNVTFTHPHPHALSSLFSAARMFSVRSLLSNLRSHRPLSFGPDTLPI
jgi:hypothetical protein